MLRTSLFTIIFANFLATVAFLVPSARGQEKELIPWARDFREAAEIATRERKLILLHFYDDNCPPCRVVEAKVFTDREVATAMSAAYVPLKVHVSKMPELARRYQVPRWPTDVIVNPAGLEVYRTVSSQDPQKYTTMLTEVATRSGTLLARNSAPPPNDPVRNALAVTNNYDSQTANRSSFTSPGGPYQPRPIEPAYNPPPRQDPPANNAPPADPYGNRMVANPYANAPANNVKAGDYTSDYAPPGAAVESPDNQVTANNPAGSNALPTPPKFENNTPAQPAANDVTRDPVQPPTAKSDLPAGLPPLGMEGYCVVTLTEGVVWKKGDRSFGAIHRGKLYLFAGPEEQKKFLADPDRFSPALSGFDPVLFTEGGTLVDGKRAFGLTFNNQMYLFTDEASRGKFESDPRRYAETVLQAMQRSNNANTKLR